MDPTIVRIPAEGFSRYPLFRCLRDWQEPDFAGALKKCLKQGEIFRTLSKEDALKAFKKLECRAKWKAVLVDPLILLAFSALSASCGVALAVTVRSIALRILGKLLAFVGLGFGLYFMSHSFQGPFIQLQNHYKGQAARAAQCIDRQNRENIRFQLPDEA